jgi:S-adenosylmethionine:tRNA ribosyltransferase-isomerase
MLGMNVSDFNFELPEELIAQEALADRAASKLLVLDRLNGQIQHSRMSEIGNFLRPGDLLVVNNSKVLPARLHGQTVSGSEVEIFLLKRISSNEWEALAKPGKKIEIGTNVICQKGELKLNTIVTDKLEDGKIILSIDSENPDEDLQKVGHVPLPPYIKRGDTPIDQAHYQTVYAKNSGSVAAPTAGLHFTPELMESLKQKRIEIVEITLHVGYGTFKPLRADRVEENKLDPEGYEISNETAEKINRAILDGRRVIAVGTTTTRTLEGVALQNNGKIIAGTGELNIFIYPGFKFQVISGLLTNFHLPQSSLIMLVSALAGRENVLHVYGEAIKNRYRFYSYGDAMLVI